MATDTRNRMIETTSRLLQHRGYHGTSLSMILSESRAPRGSLYFHFPGGKEQLAVEATRFAVEATTEQLRLVLAQSESPGEAVRRFVEAAAQIMKESDYCFGCPVAPVILDANGDVDELSKLCREAFEEWVGQLKTSFVNAGIPDDRADALALLVDSSIEGLLLIARAYRDIGPLMTVAAELERIVDDAMP